MASKAVAVKQRSAPESARARSAGTARSWRSEGGGARGLVGMGSAMGAESLLGRVCGRVRGA